MLKENGLDPMILALLQRSSLDADREHRDSNPPVTDSNDVEDVLPNHISFLEELRLQGLGKWLQRCRVMLHHVVGTPERAWLLFSLIFILETVVMAIFRPKTIKILNATHQQFEFGIAVLLLSPVVCSILAFLRSLQAEDLSMTSKPQKMLSVSTFNFWVKFSTLFQYGFITWMLSTCAGLLLSFLSPKTSHQGRVLPSSLTIRTFAKSLDLESLIPFNNQMIHNSDGRQKVCCHSDLKERKVYPRYEFRNIPKVKLKPEYLRIPICLLTRVWLDGGGDHPLARIQRV
ncbi:hypothetical protein T459_34500 [Capsicum annuum]|uniref:Calpain-type cysteine protease DEK1-like n=1 Tax=Capsicum annuum TaxID=4072 RepID=A0A2G2XW05_CAPAN|nr:hypothetical protein T459_34500 [Capsicum annuum]